MRIWLLDKVLDERFLTHRLRSTSYGGQAGAVVAAGLLAWRYYVDHRWNWELFAVLLAIVVVKIAVLVRYSLTD